MKNTPILRARRLAILKQTKMNQQSFAKLSTRWIRLSLVGIVSLMAVWGLSACQTTTKKLSAQEIVDKAITVHGGESYDSLKAAFIFRDKAYTIHRRGINYTYTRSFMQGADRVHDMLTDGKLERVINGQAQTLADTMANKYANSVNSVAYFALLPYLLNDVAVQKEYLGEGMIKGKAYYKVKVSFRAEGGGDDFSDTYIYWIHQEDFTMDYLAYDYETNGGGIRFREAINARELGGIRWQDYVNYKADPATFTVFQTDSLFETGGLSELSRIILEDIEVE